MAVTSQIVNRVKAVSLVGLGLAVAAMSLYVAEADDAPGAAVVGMLVLAAAIVLGVRALRNSLSPWTGRVALILGAALVAFVAFVTTEVRAKAVLFPSQQVPSVVGVAPGPPHAAAAARAAELVRTFMAGRELPGVSVAVGVDGAFVWTEGFGWRDAGTHTPVTPDTRFHIGSAASAVMPAAASLGLTRTGVDEPMEWSPEAIGSEAEDFPPFTMIRHMVLQPLGLVASEYPLPGDRATFYVPRADNDPRLGRRLMYLRDLECCADGMAASSTPSDLVQFALETDHGTLHGELAGGQVMSLFTAPSTGVVVAVTSNIAYAETGELAATIADVFATSRST